MRTALHLTLLVILAAVIGIGGAWLLYTQWYIVDEEYVGLKFQVVEDSKIGFDLNKTVISFGTVSLGGGADREATLETYVPATAHIAVLDAPWVSVNNATLAMEPRVPQQVIFTLNVPANATPGNYTGTVRIRYTRR